MFYVSVSDHTGVNIYGPFRTGAAAEDWLLEHAEAFFGAAMQVVIPISPEEA